MPTEASRGRPLICHINLARGYRGGERQTELLIRELAARGYRQRLVARAGEPLIEALSDVQGLSLAPVRKPFLRQASQCGDADLVHVHEAKAGHLACLANRRYGVPYVLTRRVDKPPRTSWLNRHLYANAAAVVAVSQAIAGVLQGVFPAIEPKVIIDAHSGLLVDTSHVDALKKRFAGQFVIGHAGALVDRHKGQHTLIEAVRVLSQEYDDVHLLFMGSGEDEEKLKAAAGGAANIHFEGFTDRLGDYFRILDVFAYPSRYEGLGSVLLDAMQAGLPVVASRVGGIPEIVADGQNGLLVPPGDSTALAAAIKRLYLDAELRARLSAAAVVTADRFSPAAMTERYVLLYQALEHSHAG